MVVSLGNNVYKAYNNCNATNSYFLQDNFGIPFHIGNDKPLLIELISSSPLTNPYLIGANAVNSFDTDLDLELENPLVAFFGTFQGLGPCSYFVEGYNAEPIYTYRCKAVDAPAFPPSEEDYMLYNDQVIAIKHTNVEDQNTNYLFGFSLPFMELDDARAMFNEILEDLGM